MFARTAKVLASGRRRAMQAAVGHAFWKIHEADRRNAALRLRRPVPLARWRLDPASGRPVCTWEVESPELGADLAPDLGIDPSWPMPAQQLLGIGVLTHAAHAGAAVRSKRRTRTTDPGAPLRRLGASQREPRWGSTPTLPQS